MKGIIIGIVVFIVLLAFCLWCCLKLGSDYDDQLEYDFKKLESENKQ